MIERLKSKVNLVDLVSEHVVLKKSGANYVGLCPFHNERTPSFGVSETKQLYHCHGCKAGGDLISFVMEMNGLSFGEALEDLCERAGISLPKDFSGNVKSKTHQKKQLAYRLNRFVAAFFRNQLQQHRDAQMYLQKRGIDRELQKTFYLGSAVDSWDLLAKKLIESQAPLSLAVELGLIRSSQKRKNQSVPYFDLFRNRQIFPIVDLRGKVAGFGGRQLPGEAKTSQEGPKYLNSPDSLLFQKSKLLYGLHHAAKHIRELNEVILVEGFFDVLALRKAGVMNVVATCGTALTSDHLSILKRFSHRVTVLYDGDRAGIQATEKAMEVGLQAGLVLYGVHLPDGLDPADFILSQNRKPEEIHDILVKAEPIFEKKLKQLKEKAKINSEQKTDVIKQLGRWIEMNQDPIAKELQVEQVSQELGVSPQLIKKASALSDKKSSFQKKKLEPRVPVVRLQKKSSMWKKSEQILVLSLIHWAESAGAWRQFGSKMPPGVSFLEIFEHPVSKKFVLGIFGGINETEVRLTKEVLLEGPVVSPQVVWSKLQHTVDKGLCSILTSMMMADRSGIDPGLLVESLKRANRELWARFSHQLKESLSMGEGEEDPEIQAKLMKELLDVRRKMEDFNSFYG